METKETRLQTICRQCAEKIERAIIEEIENGEKASKPIGIGTGKMFGGIYICSAAFGSKPSVVLGLDAPEIYALFEPSQTELEKRAEDLRQELTEIENKLKGETK